MEHNSTFPIKQNELDMLRDEATSYLKSVQWEQGQRAKNKENITIVLTQSFQFPVRLMLLSLK